MPNTRSFKPKTKESSDVSRQSSDVDELVGKGKVEESEVVSRQTSDVESEQPADSNQPSDNTNSSSSFEPQPSGSYRPRYGNGNGYGNGYSDSNRDQNGRDVPTEEVSGILDIMSEGHGFLRPKYTPSDRDVYISASQIRRFSLRVGDFVEGAARPPKENERYFGLLQVNKVNDMDAEKFVASDRQVKRTKFEDLTAIYPNRLLKLETGKTPMSQRVIDLVAPIGFGQRGLIVSPPKAGKTTILKEIASGISSNHPDVILMAVLVGPAPGAGSGRTSA